MSLTACVVSCAKSAAGSVSPSICSLTSKRIDLCISVSLLSAAELVERNPLPLLLHFDLHDRMYLPDRRARLADLIGMLRVEQQPAAHAHAQILPHDLAQHARPPVRVIGAHARCSFDDD